MQLDGGALSFSTLNSLFTTPLLANFALNRSSPMVPRAQPEAALLSKEPTNPEACRPQKNDIKTVSFPVPAYISTPSHQGPARVLLEGKDLAETQQPTTYSACPLHKFTHAPTCQARENNKGTPSS